MRRALVCLNFCGCEAVWHKLKNTLKTPKMDFLPVFELTVRPRDTRPQAARTSQMHVFELGPKIFEMHVFARFCTFLHVFLTNEYLKCTFLMNEYLRCMFLHVFARFCTFFARCLVHEYLRYTIHLLNNTNLSMHGFLKILHSIK